MQALSLTRVKAPIERNWYHIDAKDHIVGRLACRIATILMGKHKPTYRQSCDLGDHVVVTNANKVVFTGKKWNQKYYRWHTGYPGGLKEVLAKKWLENYPERILRKAVYGMLPKNKLRRDRMSRFKVYADENHPHQGQIASAVEVPHVLNGIARTRREPIVLNPGEYRDYTLNVRETATDFELTIERATGHKKVPSRRVLIDPKCSRPDKGRTVLKSPPPPTIYDIFPELKPPIHRKASQEKPITKAGIFATPISGNAEREKKRFSDAKQKAGGSTTKKDDNKKTSKK